MAVVGYDFGNLNSYIAVARQGGIDVLTNDYSLHGTPSCVSFGHNSRIMGYGARQQVNTNFRNSALNFKHLLGRKFSDPFTQEFKKFVPCEVVPLPGDEIGFKVEYLGKAITLTPEQLTAAFLVKLKQITEGSLGTKVHDCVISVPYFFTDHQRRALLAAGKIANLNLLKIVNDHTAVGIAYGMYKGGNFPAENEPPKIVAFVDVGHSAVQASLMTFNERKVSVLGASHDLTVGGLYFDELIRDYFHRHFLSQYKLDAQKNPRAWLRLLDESEKIKKQMSANIQAIPLNIECFMNDKDVTGKINRAQFEELAEPLFQKIRLLLRKVVDQSGVRLEDISDVEIIGGSSRVPFIKQMVAHFFNREPKTTMNQDEAVARGAGMQCAIISPNIKVKEFHVRDTNLSDIKIRYDGLRGLQEQVIFKRGEEMPFAKLLTVEKSDSFAVEAHYNDTSEIPFPDNYIGRWIVHDISQTASGEPRKIRVKIRLNANGVFSVPSATTTETVPVSGNEEATDADEPMAPADNNSDGNMHENQADGDKDQQDEQQQDGKTDRKNKEKGAKEKTRKITLEFPIQEIVPYSVNIEECIKLEREMQATDLKEKLKADAKNAVEEYCYNMRDKLSASLGQYATPQEIEKFQNLLVETEEWLYNEGEDAAREAYDSKLSNLKSVIETPIQQRRREQEEKAKQGGAEEGEEKMATDPPPTDA